MIGIFDSGLGGLSVLAAIAGVLPRADLVYLADQANAPYGGRPGEEIVELTRARCERLFAAGCDLVVLACNTASADGSSAEAVSGLGRAFFYAGTRALLVTNWPVETVSARLLTTELFRKQAEQPTLSRAQALRSAMLTVMQGKSIDPATGKAEYSYAHPLFWAPYSLVGDGGTK